jgi:hypothetical protein
MAEAGRRAWLMGHFQDCHHTERWKLAPVKYLPLGLACKAFLNASGSVVVIFFRVFFILKYIKIKKIIFNINILK